MNVDQFMEQYYFYIAISLFIVTDTGVIVSDIVSERDSSVEDYAVGFLIIGLASTLWFIAIPIILAVLVVCLYIYLVRRITKIYMKRSEE